MNSKKNLIFDADDTLWENNIYYERVRLQFLGLTDALGVERARVERKIDATEQRNIQRYGYGSENFIRSLKETYHFFSQNRDHPVEAADRIESLAQELYNFRIEFLPQVPETLRTLRSRHRFFLLTKGDDREQRAKVKKSGLEPLFDEVIVVHEKNVETYTALMERLTLDHSITWMIGNSPRSDINPALEAGLGAVYIPHAVTWHFEKVPLVANNPRLIVVEAFGDLLRHF